MSLDDLTCEICGMRYGDVDLYHRHLAAEHDPQTKVNPDRLADPEDPPQVRP